MQMYLEQESKLNLCLANESPYSYPTYVPSQGSVCGSPVRLFTAAQGRGCFSDLGDRGHLKRELTQTSDLPSLGKEL